MGNTVNVTARYDINGTVAAYDGSVANDDGTDEADVRLYIIRVGH